MDRRKFLGAIPATGLLPTLVSAETDHPEHDFRRVIVAIYHMPKIRGRGYCPACELLDKDLPRIMQNCPDAWFGVSRDGKTPSMLATHNGDSQRFRSQRAARVDCYPRIQIYSGTPGDWGFARYIMCGYSPGDDKKLQSMIQWAAEI